MALGSPSRLSSRCSRASRRTAVSRGCTSSHGHTGTRLEEGVGEGWGRQKARGTGRETDSSTGGQAVEQKVAQTDSMTEGLVSRWLIFICNISITYCIFLFSLSPHIAQHLTCFCAIFLLQVYSFIDFFILHVTSQRLGKILRLTIE